MPVRYRRARPMPGRQSGGKASAPGAPVETDPDFGSIVFLSGWEGTDGSTASFTEESPSGHTFTIPGGGVEITSDQKKFGNTSFKGFNTAGGEVADSPDLDISLANTDAFTIEYWSRQPSRNTQSQPLNRFTVGNQWAFQVRHDATGAVVFFWSTSGSDVLSLTAAGAVGAVDTWTHYCIEKNTSGKLRIYVDGTMEASDTPADSTIHASSAALFINQAGASEEMFMDELRITRGVARYDSDAGFTVPTAAFPRS